jgi:SAM-dependent methyltransferase
MGASAAWAFRGDNKLIHEFLPQDTSRQGNPIVEARQMLNAATHSQNVTTFLDVGCGTGDSYDLFADGGARLRWIGLDIMDSQEVIGRQRRELPFCFFDGVDIPLANNSVDIAYSRQVFEHVRHPERLLAEVHRVLRPDGWFVGSTSHLEPFHSRSYWNYTPYGFCVLLREAGFRSVQVRPGIDSVTLIARRFLGYLGLAGLLDRFFYVESPTNIIMEVALRSIRQPTNRRNAIKLLFSGQFCFIALK